MFAFFFAAAQVPLDGPAYADSLKKQLLRKASSDEQAITRFFLAEYYVNSNPQTAQRYLNDGIKHSINAPFLLAVSKYYSALLISDKQPIQAVSKFMESEAGLKKLNTPQSYKYRAMCWHRIALIKQKENNQKESISLLLQKAIPLARLSKDENLLGRNYLLVSAGFKNLNALDQERRYLDIAIGTLKQKKHTPHLVMAYQFLAENNIAQGVPDSAKFNLIEMRKLLLPYSDNVLWLDYYATEAFRLNIGQNFEAAFSASKKGLILSRRHEGRYAQMRLQLQQFYALLGKKQYRQAQQVALLLKDNKVFMTWDLNKLLVYEGLAKSYENTNQPEEAYRWLRLYTALNDSLNNKKLKQSANQLEVQYRTEENKKKNIALSAEIQQNKLTAKNTILLNWLLLSVSVFLFLLALLGWLFYRNSKRIALQKELIHKQELEVFDRQQQTKLVEVMLRAKEAEQNRVAKDLHDGLGAMLAMSRLNLSNYLQESANPDPELQRVLLQLSDTMSELRRIAYNMMPEMLFKLGLEASLRDLCESLSSDNFIVEFQSFGISDALKTEEKLHIYRIVQEAMTNVTKHAGAKSLLLQCSQENDRFYITIEDDGRGFDAHAKAKGVGLSNIKSRVAYLKGSMEILPQNNNQGTSMNIELHVSN
ncbi:sensor histidine kinase [Pedobacter sp. UBA5917]|uniref:sensor histidine kinase n=1 Tax=Pedobacter sp. UBA5917 TaxID=1947061 RepID=UPI0025DBBB29|nr:sensor histidine kinase [Pedobacter sp. UBA5917]